MNKLKLHKFVLSLFALLVVVRLPENYSFQPSYILYFLVPVYVYITQALFAPGKLIYCFAICYAYFFSVDFFYLMALGVPEKKISNFLYWPLAFLLIMSFAVMATSWLVVLVKSISFWLGLSIFFAACQFVIEFPTRAFGLTGSPNNLALSVIHLVTIRAILKMPPLHYSYVVLAVVNLSRGYLIFLMLYLARNYLRILLLILFILAILFTFSSVLNLDFIFDFLNDRFNFFGNSSDESGRGTARFWSNPEYLVLGAGDLRTKYPGDTFAGQIHNNFLALWFCFGIPGFLFGLLFFVLLVKSVGVYLSLIYFIFSLSHYFYSNIFFAVLIACLINVNKKNYRYLARLRF